MTELLGPSGDFVVVEIKDNHIPEDVYKLAREKKVFYQDGVTKELIRILDVPDEKAATP
jgi:hypothetical protein